MAAKNQNTVSHAKREAAKPASAKMGRPVEPIPEHIKEEILHWVAHGGTLRAYSRQEGKPHYTTVYSWIVKDPEFSQRFATSREAGLDFIAEETMEIADDASNDWMEKFDRDGQSTGWVLNGEHVQRSKLRIETRLKLLAKWNPKKYGDKVEQTVNHSGSLEITRIELVPMTK